MQRGEEILRSKGFDHVNIFVASNDLELQEYYQKQGYEKGNTYTWMFKEVQEGKCRIYPYGTNL